MTLRYDGTNINSVLGLNTDFGNVAGAGSVLSQKLPGGTPGLLTQEGMFGQSGWVMPAAQLGAGALQSFLGLKQLKLAKDMFRQQSAYAATDLANQAKTVNERLETRQNRRLQEGTSTVPVSEFMSKHAVSGKVGG
jgi:hypothetical protein